MENYIGQFPALVAYRAINHYGEDKQMEQTIEEFAEFVLSAQKHKRANGVYGSIEPLDKRLESKDAMISEIADVLFMTVQVIEIKDKFKYTQRRQLASLDLADSIELLEVLCSEQITYLLKRKQVNTFRPENFYNILMVVLYIGDVAGWHDKFAEIIKQKADRLKIKMENEK
jgi:phosphoribosyl-ATP pyrophosphohydrolase